MSLRLRRDVYDRAVRRAEREEKTLSELARDALEEYVAKEVRRASTSSVFG